MTVEKRWQEAWSAALGRAHDRWPASWVPDEVFVEHVRERLPAGRDPALALADLAVADLYLACACARGVPAAHEAFARTILVEADAHVTHIDRSPAFADDVRQILGAKLMAAPPGATPKIADYAGTAPLSAWVRIAAIRAALNLRRGKAQAMEHLDDRALAERAGGADVELDVIRRRYGEAFEAAVARALAALPTRDRTLLRLRLVEGMEGERMATMYGVHRATITRWLDACRDKLAAETRRILADELGLGRSELESLAGLVQSQLHVSLARLLAAP